MRTKGNPFTEPFFLGLDLSLTSTGVVVLDANAKLVVAMSIKVKTRGAERLSDIEAQVKQIIRNSNPKYACIEGYSMGFGGKQNTGRIADLGELGGVIRLLLYKFNIPYSTPVPLQVKKYATGKGQGEKSQIMMAVFKQWGFEAKDDDQADAYVLARIARALRKGDDTMTTPQKEVIQAIKNPPVKKKKGKKDDV